MEFLTDERAQAIQIGAVLLFGVLILFLSLYQAFVVPDQNEEIEFNHNQQLQQQLTELRSTVILMPGSTSTRASSIDLGTRYPSRAIFVNPGPASGTLRTVGTEDKRVNVTITNATAVEAAGETRDFWNGTALSYDTGGLEYQPGYNLYQGAPRTVYEHSVLYNAFERENVTQSVTGQTLVDGNRITVIAVDGSLTENRVGTLSMDVDPISTRTRVVELDGTADPVTLQLATGMSEEEWNETFEDELVGNGGHVQNVSVSPDGPGDLGLLEVTLEAGERYQLELAKVGVGTGATGTDAEYLTDVAGNGTTLESGDTEQLTVEARDRFNGPESGVTVTADAAGGTFTGGDAEQITDNDGQVTYEYQAGSVGTQQINFTIDPGYDPDGSHDANSPTNVSMQVTVESSSGSGGGAYNTTWQDPHPFTDPIGEVDGVTYDDDRDVYVYNETEAGQLDLVMETDPVAADALVEFSVNDTRAATVDPASNRTLSDGTASTTLDPEREEPVRVYTASGGTGDSVVFDVVDAVGQQFDTLQLNVQPNTTGSAAVHNWTFDDVEFTCDDSRCMDTITLDYNGDATLDGTSLDVNDVTFSVPGNDDVRLNSVSVVGDALVLDVDGTVTSDPNGGGFVRVDGTDGGLQNPTPSGTYDATIEFDGQDEPRSGDLVSQETSYPVVDPPFFDVTIDSAPDSVAAGEDVVVDYTVENTGGLQDTQDIVFEVNGTQETVEADVTLGGGDTFSDQFTYTTGSGDTPAIETTVSSNNDTAAEVVTVNEPPFFEVTIDSVTDPVTEGEDVVVDYTVENTGSVTDTQDIVFEVNGTQETVEADVNLGGGDTFSDQFTYTTGSGDTPAIETTVSSNNDSASRTVTVNEPPFFEVTIDNTNSPVTEGETLTADVTVTNTGGVTDTQTLNLTDSGFTGTERDSVAVTLGSGATNSSITLEWQTSNGDAGTGNVTVFSENDSDSQNVTVNEPLPADAVAFDDANRNGVYDTNETIYTETDFVGANFNDKTVDLVIARDITADSNKIQIKTNTVTVRSGVELSTTGNNNIDLESQQYVNVSDATIDAGKDIFLTSGKASEADIRANNTILQFSGKAEASAQKGGTLFVNDTGDNDRSNGGTYIEDQNGNAADLKLKNGDLPGQPEKGTVST